MVSEEEEKEKEKEKRREGEEQGEEVGQEQEHLSELLLRPRALLRAAPATPPGGPLRTKQRVAPVRRAAKQAVKRPLYCTFPC
jgi:hypothetical protein